jgi:Ni/Fe-hydrogenase subunit HybB-like protein
MVHGEVWTLKELFVLPNEYIYWSLQIVMYPFMTGLVAGSFVLSSLYHVFGVKQLKDMARFALVFSFSLLFAAPLTLLLHLQFPQRGFNVFLTPHFTSAIASFGVVFFIYASIVATELWLVYRRRFVEISLSLRGASGLSFGKRLRRLLYTLLTLGSFDVSGEALQRDEKAVKIFAGIGIPVAMFLHGYVGFIFGSVKANALWMTPLMPVIFIMSAVVSGIALCMLTYVITQEIRKLIASRRAASETWRLVREEIKSAEISMIRLTARYLLAFLVAAISLELLDLMFKGYTAVKSWDVLRNVIYRRDFVSIFIFQYAIGDLLPIVLLLLPRLTLRRASVAVLLVLFGVFMMRWNVVIGGQAFSLTFAGFMHYRMPIIPHDWETFKEGLFGALSILVVPFVIFWIIGKILPVFTDVESKRE